MKPEHVRFLEKILPKAIELEKELPQIYLRMRSSDFLEENNALWFSIRSKIIARYPQYSELLQRNDLAFRVVFRPADANSTLPGFTDKEDNTRTLFLWYGMDYKPEEGEYIGMTREIPWSFYMLPDVRFAEPTDYQTFIYIYDNEGNQLVKEGEATVGPLPEDNHLTSFVKMMINVFWVNVGSEQVIDNLVYDSTLEDLWMFLERAGFFDDEPTSQE